MIRLDYELLIIQVIEYLFGNSKVNSLYLMQPYDFLIKGLMFHIEKCKIFGLLIYDTFNNYHSLIIFYIAHNKLVSQIEITMTNQTPFQLLQRQDKERRLKVLNNIERKDLKRRSISYNLKGGDYRQIQINDKHQPREQYSSIAINNSIKKSYYYRKLLNKSIDVHMTSEDFQTVKHTFDKITKQDYNCQNKAAFFRGLWEKQLTKKEDNYQLNERQNYLEIISTNNYQKEKDSIDKQPRKKEENIKKNILDIAEERRTSLDFDLEILGKKKSIRIKDSRNKININRTFTTQKESKGDQIEANTIIDSQTKQSIPQNTNVCSFFKRFQQQNLLPKHQSGNNQFLKITKMGHNLFPFTTTNYLENQKIKKLRLKNNQSQLETNSEISRYIQSCWKVHRISQQRPNKAQSSQDKRPTLQKINRDKLPIFINDIKGWIVGQQNDEQLLQNFS